MDEERFNYEVDDATRFVDNLKDRVHDLYDKNEELKEEIERLNNIIKEFEDILKRDIKACNNKFENMFDRNYRRLILEEKLEQLQELKGSNNNE